MRLVKILYGKQHNGLLSPIFLLTIYFRVLSDETETKIIIKKYGEKGKKTKRNIRGSGTFFQFQGVMGAWGEGGGAVGMTNDMEWGG